MTRRLRGVILAMTLAAIACTRGKSVGPRAIAPGDAVWFSAGLPADPTEAEEILARGGFNHVFLPALRVAREGGAWRVAQAPPPARPLAATSVVLIVEGDATLTGSLEPVAGDRLAASIGEELKRLLAAHGTAFGRVEGVHLDLPLSQAASETFGTFAAQLRSRVPANLFLTCSLRFAPTEKEREDFVKRTSGVDGFVAFVFGEGAGADPVTADALGKAWWSGYSPSARGEWTSASGSGSGTLTEKHLRALTDDARVTLGHDLSLRQEGVSGFIFRPSAPVEIAGSTFGVGDQISFRQPLLSELLYRFGSDLAGRRFVRGRLVVLDGASDSERIFTLEALSDVLLGRPLQPDLHVTVTAEASGVRIAAENRSFHVSVVSRTSNWVEVDVPSGHIRDVQLGGFDRYEVFDAEGHAVTPGRATRVRFYETLVGPKERIEDATILVRGRPPADCCRFRQHLLAAAGTELAGDWIAPPPPPPTPTPISRSKPGSKPKHRGH